MKCFFVVPTFNKENLIERVIEGIHISVSNQIPYKIIFVIDGCTDNTEKILKEYTDKHQLQNVVDFVYADDVHEIKSLNVGLSYLRDNLNPHDNDIVFTVQDDVVIKEKNFDLCYKKLFDTHDDLGYITSRLGCKLHSTGSSVVESNFVESEFGHWSILGLNNFKKMFRGQFLHTEIALRSPTGVLWNRYKKVGFYNEDLAPVGFDCHDFSIRMNIAGYKNGVFVLKYQSELNWGSTREKSNSPVNSKTNEIYERNKTYLAKTYKDYFNKKVY